MADGVDFSELLKRTVQANAKFYKGWLDLSFEYFQGISGVLGGAPSSSAPVQEVDTGSGALVLEGEAGTVVRGSFLVSNDMDKPVSCAFAGSDFKDPRGASVTAKTDFEPSSLQLAPGEQRVVQVAIALDDRLLPGVGYAGEIQIKGMEGFSVPVVLRRQHTMEGVPADDATTPDKNPDANPDTTRTPRGPQGMKSGKRKASKR